MVKTIKIFHDCFLSHLQLQSKQSFVMVWLVTLSVLSFFYSLVINFYLYTLTCGMHGLALFGHSFNHSLTISRGGDLQEFFFRCSYVSATINIAQVFILRQGGFKEADGISGAFSKPISSLYSCALKLPLFPKFILI